MAVGFPGEALLCNPSRANFWRKSISMIRVFKWVYQSSSDRAIKPPCVPFFSRPGLVIPPRQPCEHLFPYKTGRLKAASLLVRRTGKGECLPALTGMDDLQVLLGANKSAVYPELC